MRSSGKFRSKDIARARLVIALVIVLAIFGLATVSLHLFSIDPVTQLRSLYDKYRPEEKPKPAWVYGSSQTDEYGKVVVAATLPSKNTITLGPERKKSHVNLNVREIGGPIYEISFKSDGYFHCDPQNGSQINVTFDSMKPMSQTCVLPKAGNTQTIFLEAPYLFSTYLPTTKTVSVDLDFYGEGKQKVEFDTEGFDRAKLRSAEVNLMSIRTQIK